MSKARNLAKVSAKGGFNLFWGVTLSTLITSIGVIIIGRTLSVEEMGIVSVVLIAPNLIKSFRDFGIDQATIKYIAQYRSENKLGKIKQVLATEIFFEFVFGLLLSIISFLLSDFMAVTLERPEIGGLIQIASIIIFAEALLKAAQVAFTGYERMGYYSISMVIQSTVKTGLMVFLVINGYGVYGATIGDVVSYVFAGSLSIVLVYFILYNKLKHEKVNLEILNTLKYMFKYGIPVSIAWIINAFLTQFYHFLIAIYSTDLIMGNYQIALSFAVIVTFFVVPLNTILFPAFSKIDAKKEPEILKKVFRSSVKYSTLIVIPATFAVSILSEPATSTIFGEKYELTPLYLSLYVGIYLYTAFGGLSAGNLINSQGRTEINLKFTLITAVMGLSLSLLLVPLFGVVGLLVTYLIAGIPSTLLALLWIKRNYDATIDWNSSIRIVLSSALTSILTYLFIIQLNQTNWINLFIGAIIFFGLYIVISPLIGSVTKDDIKYLKEMIKTLGSLSSILNMPLVVSEKIIDIFQRK